MTTAPSVSTSGVFCRAVRVTKFDFAHYRQKDVLLRINQINELEVPLHDISDAHLPSLVQSLCVYWFEHTRGTLSVTTVAMTTRSEACEGSPSSTLCVLDGAAYMILLDERHRLRVQRGFQETGGVVLVEAHLQV